MIAQLPGYQVGFDDSGDGLPVVFLHGFPHDRTLWTAQRTSLAPPPLQAWEEPDQAAPPPLYPAVPPT